jgi:hypothetical protein
MNRASIVLLPALLTWTLLGSACGRDEPEPETPAIASLDHLSEELDRLQGDVQRKNQEIARLLEDYQKRGGKLPDTFGPDLTDEQRELLARRFNQEKLGLRSTLQDILDRDKEIAGLKQRIAEIETFMPTSVAVKDGETHEAVVRRFLRERGIDDVRAGSLLEHVSLQDPLLPGHRVWVYYQHGALGTWVTTGDAPASPQFAAREAIRVLVAQRDEARTHARSLLDELRGVRRERTALRKEVDGLRAQIGDWAREADDMRTIARSSLRAARYMVGSKRELRRRGIISESLLKGTRVRRLTGLDTLDLTQSAEILLEAREHHLPRIRKVKLLPDGFERDQDYAVHLLKRGTAARVALLDVNKFQRSTFVVVLE